MSAAGEEVCIEGDEGVETKAGGELDEAGAEREEAVLEDVAVRFGVPLLPTLIAWLAVEKERELEGELEESDELRLHAALQSGEDAIRVEADVVKARFLDFARNDRRRTR